MAKRYFLAVFNGNYKHIESTGSTEIDLPDLNKSLVYLNPFMTLDYRYKTSNIGGISGSSSKIFGIKVDKFDSTGINYIIAFETNFKPGIIEDIEENSMRLNEDFEFSFSGGQLISFSVSDYQFLKFEGKKDLTAELKNRLSKDELIQFNSVAAKLDVVNKMFTGVDWGDDGLLGLRKVKIFKESFLEDKEFIKAILTEYFYRAELSSNIISQKAREAAEKEDAEYCTAAELKEKKAWLKEINALYKKQIEEFSGLI